MSKKKYFLILVTLFLAIGTTSLFIPKNLNSTIYGTIEGRVIADDTGEGLKGVKVYLTEAKYGGHFGRAVTDENGYFKIGMVKEGLYKLAFVPKPPYISGTIPEPSPPPLAVHKLQKIPKDIITMEKGNILYFEKILRLGGSISGTVYKKENGISPLAGAEVLIHSTDVSSYSHSTKTDSNGKFKLEALEPDGEYLVVAIVFGYARKNINSVIVEAGKETSGIDFIIDFTDKTCLEGIVISSIDGKPIKNVNVHVFKENELVASVHTDEDGKYSVLAMQPGIYTIMIPYGGYESKISTKKNIYIEKEKTTTVNFSLDRSSN